MFKVQLVDTNVKLFFIKTKFVKCFLATFSIGTESRLAYFLFGLPTQSPLLA
jgi:hypothetical protein